VLNFEAGGITSANIFIRSLKMFLQNPSRLSYWEFNTDFNTLCKFTHYTGYAKSNSVNFWPQILESIVIACLQMQ